MWLWHCAQPIVRAEPDGARRVDAIDQRLPACLFDVDAAFLIEQRVAMEAGGDPLSRRGVGQHVAGELLDRELSNGMSSFSALITQSRYFHIVRRLSFSYPLLSA